MTLQIFKKAEGSSPASNIAEIFMDTVDNKIKSKDYNGVVTILSDKDSRSANIIMNGGLSIQQRVATASTAITGVSTTTRAGVVADRWAVTTSVATNLNWQQVDTNGAEESNLISRFYGSIISSTAGKKVMLSEWIINRECAHLKGKKVRLTVKIRQKVGTTGQLYKIGLLQLNVSGTIDVSPAFLSGAWSATTGVDPSWGKNLAAITPQSTGALNGTVTGSYLNITTTAGWTKYSVVFTCPTNFKNLIPVVFADATGGTTDNISFAEFGLYLGEDDVDWQEPPFSVELAKCQAYYCKTFAYGTVPAQNAGANTGEAKLIAGKAGAVANAGFIFWRFPVTMWKTPVTVTTYNPAAANAQVRDLTATVDHSATTAATQLDSSVRFTSTGNASTAVGDEIGLHITADAEIVA